MSNQLIQNIRYMFNHEIIGLARNRYLPREVQMAIAKHHYRRAHFYLAEVPNLDHQVRDYLWSDECNKGYTIKTCLLQSGQYDLEPEKFTELYERYPSGFDRSRYRFLYAILGPNYRRYGHSSTSSAAPPELLNRVYDEKYSPRVLQHSSCYSTKYELRRFASHDNVDIRLAIKLSQCGIKDVETLAFKKIVELSQ